MNLNFKIPFFVLILAVNMSAILSGCATPSSNLDDDTSQEESSVRKRARVRLELAAVYFSQGQLNTALIDAKRAVTIDPEWVDAHRLLGLINMELKEWSDAEKNFKKALRLAPRDGNTLHNYGWMLCQQGKYRLAQKRFKEALGQIKYLEKSKTWLAIGICQQRAGDSVAAKKSLVYVLGIIAPQSLNRAIVVSHLSQALITLNEYKEAQFYLRQINSGEQASPSTLWLGIIVERRLKNLQIVDHLGNLLQQRFSHSREALAWEKGEFDE